MSDLIDRQKAIDVAKEELDNGTFYDIPSKIESLPSAQPERKKGKWIEYIPQHGKCPFCGNQVDLLDGKGNNFCGECGAEMEGE